MAPVEAKTKIKPLGDRVVIRSTAREEVTKSGIVLPDTAKEKPQEGEVVAVGPGRVSDDGKRVAMEVKEGDIVIYAKYAGSEIKLDDEEYLILGEKDILAVLQK
jgi:chaperonin GroES